MKRKKYWIQIISFLALFAIIIWIIWTWLIIILGDNNSSNNTELTPEQYKELMEQININNTGSIEDKTTTNIEVWTWNIEVWTWTKIGTWNIENN